MANERWEKEGEEVQVGGIAGFKQAEGKAGGGSRGRYKPIPSSAASVELDPMSPNLVNRDYKALKWTEEDWGSLERHYMAQIDRLYRAYEEEEIIGMELWMEMTKLIILLLNELGLTRLNRMFYLTLFYEGRGPLIESLRIGLDMTKSEYEEWELEQLLKGSGEDYGEKGEEEVQEPEGGGHEEGRHFWSPRPEAVDETG
ncbi:MAG: hypothetical protein QXT73_06955 [Candidatus Methanomethylicaceae archaeon]